MNPKRIRAASATVFTIGLALMILMITTESEPGALPLALVLAGAVGWSIGWRRGRQ